MRIRDSKTSWTPRAFWKKSEDCFRKKYIQRLKNVLGPGSDPEVSPLFAVLLTISLTSDYHRQTRVFTTLIKRKDGVQQTRTVKFISVAKSVTTNGPANELWKPVDTWDCIVKLWKEPLQVPVGSLSSALTDRLSGHSCTWASTHAHSVQTIEQLDPLGTSRKRSLDTEQRSPTGAGQRMVCRMALP
jgi:hypothetical protein